MQNSVYKNYNLGYASWNQLSKSEYLQLERWMKSRCISDPNENHISEKIYVKYETGNYSAFKPEEFVKYFSSSSEYSGLRISVSSSSKGDFFLACDFSKNDIWRGIAVSGEATLPELEDLADEIKQYVENLYMNKIESLSDKNYGKGMPGDLVDENKNPEMGKAKNDNKKIEPWTIIGVLIAAAAFLWAIISYFGVV